MHTGILRLIADPSSPPRTAAAASSTLMRRLCSRSRPLLPSTASSPPRRWPAALVRRVFPPTEPPSPPVGRAHGFPQVSRNMASSSGAKTNEETCMDVTHGDEGASREAMKVADGTQGRTVYAIFGSEEGNVVDNDDEEYLRWLMARDDGVSYLHVMPKTGHRDGSIYNFNTTHQWKKEYRITDHDETCLEAMMLTEPPDCFFVNGFCLRHPPTCMFQIFSLKLTEIIADDGLVQLYGYIAVRDDLDALLNYIVSFTRDDPIIVEKGSLITMTGPKRGIEFSDEIAIEYDMRIKVGEQEKHDLQLIDGASSICKAQTSHRRTVRKRIHGDSGAIDISISHLEHAVEATVDVLISEVQRGFNLCLCCFTSGLNEEIRLFDGTIGKSRCLKRSVVVVTVRSWMELKFKVGPESSNSAEHCCSFRADSHGLSTQKIKTNHALISVNVTWSPLPRARFF